MAQDMPKPPKGMPQKMSMKGDIAMPKAPSSKPKGGGGHEHRGSVAPTPRTLGPRAVA